MIYGDGDLVRATFAVHSTQRRNKYKSDILDTKCRVSKIVLCGALTKKRTHSVKNKVKVLRCAPHIQTIHPEHLHAANAYQRVSSASSWHRLVMFCWKM